MLRGGAGVQEICNGIYGESEVREMKKKIISVAAVLVMCIILAGCTEADKVSENVSQEVKNYFVLFGGARKRPENQQNFQWIVTSFLYTTTFSIKL